MSPVFVMTSRWWMDCGATPLWHAVKDPASWPLWWYRLQSGGQAGVLLWRTPWLSRMELHLRRTAEQPYQTFEYAIDGDVKGRIHGVLQYIPHIRGAFMTIRLEVVLSAHQRNAMLLALVSWRHFTDMRHSVGQLGHLLRCATGTPREWCGHVRN